MPIFYGSKRWKCNECGSIFVATYKASLTKCLSCNNKLTLIEEITPKQLKEWWDEYNA